MQISEANSRLKRHVHSLLVRRMSRALADSSVDLGDPKAVSGFLHAKGYGEATIAHLMDRAVSIAQAVRRNSVLFAAAISLFLEVFA